MGISKSKFFAVFAVALMLCSSMCIVLGTQGTDNEASAVETSSNREITEAIESLRNALNLGMDQDVMVVESKMLEKTKDTDIPTEVTNNITIDSEHKSTILSGTAFNKGVITVEAEAVLELKPDEKGVFSLVNKDTSTKETYETIVFKSHSMILCNGLCLKIIFRSETKSLELIPTTDKEASFTFTYFQDSVMSFNVAKYTKIKLFGLEILGHTDESGISLEAKDGSSLVFSASESSFTLDAVSATLSFDMNINSARIRGSALVDSIHYGESTKTDWYTYITNSNLLFSIKSIDITASARDSTSVLNLKVDSAVSQSMSFERSITKVDFVFALTFGIDTDFKLDVSNISLSVSDSTRSDSEPIVSILASSFSLDSISVVNTTFLFDGGENTRDEYSFSFTVHDLSFKTEIGGIVAESSAIDSIKVTVGNGMHAVDKTEESDTIGNLDFVMTIDFDGADRVTTLHASDVSFSDGFSAKKVDLAFHIPGWLLNSDDKQIFDGSLTCEGLSCDDLSFKRGMTIKGSWLSLTTDHPSKYYPVVDVFNVNLRSGFSVVFSEMDFDKMSFTFTATAGSFDGYLKDVGMEKQPFSLDAYSGKSPNVTLHVSPDDVADLTLDSCTAVFKGGMLPVRLVCSGTVDFKADGLRAYSFYFSGYRVKGTVSINVDEQHDEEQTIRENSNLVVSIKSCCAGFTLTVELGVNPTNCGTIDTNEGYVVPSDPGQARYIKHSDTSAVCIFLTHTENVIDYSMEARTYALEIPSTMVSERHHTGDTVTLDPLDDRGNIKFLAWTDGSTLITKGQDGRYAYTMPSRDVTLTPIFVDTKPTVGTSTHYANCVFADEDIYAVVVDRSIFDGLGDDEKTIVYFAEDTRIEFDKRTAMRLFSQSDSQKLIFVQYGKTHFNTTDISTVFENGQMCSISIFDENMNEYSYDTETEFDVSLPVYYDGSSDCDLVYVDEHGHYSDVSIKGFAKISDSTYLLSFHTNHFSDFLFIPDSTAQKDGNYVWLVVVVAIAVIALLAICLGLFVRYYAKKH